MVKVNQNIPYNEQELMQSQIQQPVHNQEQQLVFLKQTKPKNITPVNVLQVSEKMTIIQPIVMAPMPSMLKNMPIKIKPNNKRMAKYLHTPKIYCDKCNYTDTKNDTKYSISPIQWKLCIGLFIVCSCLPCIWLAPCIWDDWSHLWTVTHSCRNCKRILYTIVGNWNNNKNEKE